MCRSLVLAAAIGAAISCGKKGDPLAPLRLVPDAPTGFSARRLGPDVHLRFVVPSKNLGAEGAVDIDRIEIYAVSIPPGAPAPPNTQFLVPEHVVGTVQVRPADASGEPGEAVADPATPDTRPAPGEPATFVEPLTTEMLNPPAVATPVPAAAATPATSPGPASGTRIYAVRGVSRGGRPGAPSPRLTVPLVPAPDPPSSVEVSFTATSFVVSWVPPLSTVGGPTLLFNVYRAESPAVPLTAEPVAMASADVPGVEFGVERCFSVRTIQQVGGVPLESETSAPACATPRDTFPPAPPEGLTGVATPGLIALIWDASPEADFGGYLVLRGEAGGDTLQPLTPEPIRETSYRDTTVTPGVRYVYAVVAVDRATPPNRSAESGRVEVTAAQ